MEWDDNVIEELDVFVPQRYGKPADDRSKDVKNLRSTVKFVCLMDQNLEGLIHDLPHHLSSWHYSRIHLMEDILEVLPL